MRVFETCKSDAREFRAGKYMFEETALKKPPQEAMKTMKCFWFLVKTECSGPAEETVESVCFASDVAVSSFAVSVLSRLL